MTHLQEGELAPSFQGMDEKGNLIQLEDFKGKQVILFFYPKDNTPGCTAEVCNFRDHFQQLKELGFELVGVSPDSARKHQNFINKFELPFPLIADTEKEILKQYGVWGPKKMFGNLFDGVYRTTFVIDEAGKIKSIFKKVDTKNHTQQILKKLGMAA